MKLTSFETSVLNNVLRSYKQIKTKRQIKTSQLDLLPPVRLSKDCHPRHRLHPCRLLVGRLLPIATSLER